MKRRKREALIQNYTGIVLKLFGYNLSVTTIVISHLQRFKHPGFLCYYSQDQKVSGRPAGRRGVIIELKPGGLLGLSSFLLQVAL